MAHDQILLDDELYAYLKSVADRETPLLVRLREETRSMPFGFWQIPAIQGQFMHLLVKLWQPGRILEVGTFTGYSSVCMGTAMAPDARMVCLDTEKKFTDIAERYWREAGIADRIELRLGRGVALMDALIAERGPGSFDLVFIDANKDEYQAYYERALVLVRQGGLILVDNTLFNGRVIGKNLAGLKPWQLEFNEAMKKFNAALHKDPRVTLALVPLGDGMTFCVKN
jgi:predicted O-methyltransferase YrrM